MTDRILRIVAYLLLAAGCAMMTVSASMKPYSDSTAYTNAVAQIDAQKSGVAAADVQFDRARKEYLTPKYDVMDYGTTSIILGAVLLLTGVVGVRRVRAPRRAWAVGAVGLAAVLVTVAAGIAELHIASVRGALPQWADSAAIPLSADLILGGVLLAWVLINLAGVRGECSWGRPLCNISWSKGGMAFAFLTTVVAGLLLWYIGEGNPWFTATLFVWLYFYLSIMAVRSGAKKSK